MFSCITIWEREHAHKFTRWCDPPWGKHRHNVYTAYTCEEESFKITEVIDLSIRMSETVAEATQVPPDQLQLPEQETPRKDSKSKEHKEVQLVDGSPEKTALIKAILDPK